MFAGELIALEWFAGRWDRALELSRSAKQSAELTAAPTFLVWAWRTTALLEVDCGLVVEARATMQRGLALAEEIGSAFLAGLCRGPLGRLALALGDVDAAAAELEGLSDALRSGALHDPTNPIWSDAIETLIALGRLDEAIAHLDRQEQLARRLGGPWALAAAARGRGLLALAEGDPDGALGAFEHALTILGDRYPLDCGRTLLGLGAAHRKARRKRLAREAFAQALAVFDGLGAPLWAEKARAEMQRISGRRTSTELTETEHRVAALAGEGRSNKEIAAALFVSEHTVAAHLTHAYRKLGVRSRAALAHRLAAKE
jgi:DNA-binding CsgD family transcriptional regulator